MPSCLVKLAIVLALALVGGCATTPNRFNLCTTSDEERPLPAVPTNASAMRATADAHPIFPNPISADAKYESWYALPDGHTKLCRRDRKSTRLNSSHGYISYAVFCLKKKKNKK